MSKEKRLLKTMGMVLLAAFLLTYVLVGFMPHTHGCADRDCAICAMVETARKRIVCMALSIALLQGICLITGALPDNGPTRSIREGTPVGLRVKLSD